MTDRVLYHEEKHALAHEPCNYEKAGVVYHV
jgi:hypothetical protein